MVNARAAFRAVGVVSIGALIASMLAFASAASGADTNGEARTFSQVDCSARVGGSTLTQKQDITVHVVAPNGVAPGATFGVSFPSLTSNLPSSAQGLTITSYRDLSTTYRVTGASSVVAGSGTTDGPATINGEPTPAEVRTAGNDISGVVPGPVPPGTLVTPNGAAQIVAGADGSAITISRDRRQHHGHRAGRG